MLATYVNGYAYGFGQAPTSFVQYFAQMSKKRQLGAGFQGLGQPANDFIAFNNGQSSPASFVGDPAGFGLGNVVFCNKEAGTNRPQCILNQTGDGARAPIRAMQLAADRIITLINQGLRNQLAGDQLCAQFPRADGSGTFENCAPIGQIQDNPIASGGGGGIDGIVGDTTRGVVGLALTFAGALKQVPLDARGRNVMIAIIEPLNNGIQAEMSGDIAAYLNDVADNFPALVEAFKARGGTSIQTVIDPATIEALPFVLPAAVAGTSNKKAIIAATAAMIGLTSVAAYAAGVKKPMALYADKPALGRGRRRRSRRY
jgi:hypothetical protein